ncbi:MAG TPA: thioredoxin domain-containing protein [Thermoanaerobaculia bacterium]|nr:thioredoxin domain-containing protein [Thermoanaerobaculia bacterium]
MNPTPDPSRSPRLAPAVRLAVSLLLCSFLAGCPAGGDSGEADKAGAAGQEVGDVLATVGGEEVTRAEVEAAAAEALEQVEQGLVQCRAEAELQRHQVLEGETRKLVRERLLEAAAAERGMTEDQLLQAEVQSRVAAVTPADVDAFYQGNRERIGPVTKEQVAPQIEQYLRQQRESEAYQAFISGLEEANQVAYEIGPFRVEVATAGEPARGSAEAPVTIIEFSDFECPFCSRVVPTLDQIQEHYGDRVRLVFKQFPLRSIHPNAQKAAEASLCAEEQGRFWELHDAMFADQRNLAVPALKAKAGEVGLDPAAFADCLDSGRYAEAVEEDLQEGSAIGISGTPAMVINGRLLSGAVPYEEIARVVDEELARQGGQS